MQAKPQQWRNGWRIRWVDATGKRRSEMHTNYEDAEFALNRHLVAREEARRGLRRVAPSHRTFDDLADEWQATRARAKRSANKDEQFARLYLRPRLGAKRLVDVDAGDLERLKADIVEPARLGKLGASYEVTAVDIASGRELRARYASKSEAERAVRARRRSKKTANLVLGLANAMLGLAVERGWLDRKPKVRLYRLKDTAYRYLETADDVRRFLEAAREIQVTTARVPTEEDRAFGEFLFAFYSTAVFTGLRAGEIAGLRWSDIDFDRRLITVARSFDGPTKSDETRHVPILDALAPTLKAWRLRSAGKRDGLVFTNRAGGMLEPCSRVFRENLKKTMVQAGLSRDHMTFHGTRHTFASHWVMRGGDLYKLQRILGHASVQMTQRYAHLAPHAFADDHSRFEGLAGSDSSVSVVRGLHERWGNRRVASLGDRDVDLG